MPGDDLLVMMIDVVPTAISIDTQQLCQHTSKHAVDGTVVIREAQYENQVLT